MSWRKVHLQEFLVLIRKLSSAQATIKCWHSKACISSRERKREQINIRELFDKNEALVNLADPNKTHNRIYPFFAQHWGIFVQQREWSTECRNNCAYLGWHAAKGQNWQWLAIFPSFLQPVRQTFLSWWLSQGTLSPAENVCDSSRRISYRWVEARTSSLLILWRRQVHKMSICSRCCLMAVLLEIWTFIISKYNVFFQRWHH